VGTFIAKERKGKSMGLRKKPMEKLDPAKGD